MAQLQSIAEQRHDQIYPTLDPLEIERVRRFGNLRSFSAGESLWTIGQVASGLMVILAGKVAVTERSWICQFWATAATPAVRQLARLTSSSSTGVGPWSSEENTSGWSPSKTNSTRWLCS